MREAFYGIVQYISLVTGNSKIIILFLLSMLALVLINNNKTDNESDCDRRRLTNPAVFLLSLWSGIAYTVVRLQSTLKRSLAVIFGLFSLLAIALSGSFVISEEAYKNSIYFYTNNTITALSVLCIIVFFIIYYLIAGQLFNKRSEKILFMICILTLHLFGYYSEEAAKFSLFLSPLTIASVVIHDLLPLLLWLYLLYEEKITEILIGGQDDTEENEYTGNNENVEEIPEEWDMKKHKILNMRNMAIAFAALLILLLASVFVLNSKINSLYNATVVLESAANTKMSVYELKGADDEVALTLMVSPNGTVTAIGGSGLSNKEECTDFVNEHAEKIDKWYLYGDEDDYKNAYDFCNDAGISVSETYIISGIEKLED